MLNYNKYIEISSRLYINKHPNLYNIRLKEISYSHPISYLR